MEVLNDTETASLAMPARVRPKHEPVFARFLTFVSSVRLGIALLILLVTACVIGMLVMQQNVEGFADYYAALTPAQQYVFGRLGFFNVYHSWYFNALLSALSLNIILATVNRFPKVWPYYSKPSVTVPVRWLRSLDHSAEFFTARSKPEIAAAVARGVDRSGFRNRSQAEKNGTTYIFAQSGVWNRFMFCVVHVGLLTIFLGGFLTAQLGDTGDLSLAPGESSDLILDNGFQLDKVVEITKRLPFEVEVTDVQQKLIRQDGPLSANNTIDWITYFTIKDETGTHAALVQMNRPFDYRGYRFFQSSFTPIGRARNVTLAATPIDAGESQTLRIQRNGSAILSDGTKVRLAGFRANFHAGAEDPDEDTSDYKNPAAILEVIAPNGTPEQVTAFGANADDLPITGTIAGGYAFKMLEFEKASDRHVLAVQRDPGANVVYLGFAVLCTALIGVFFFSHRRVWAAVMDRPDGMATVVLAGHTNRHRNGFDEEFRRLKDAVRRELDEQQKHD